MTIKMTNLKQAVKTGVSTLLILATGSSLAMSKTKFEWDATESAPKHYPMKIIDGTFVYRGETDTGLYIPSGGNLKAGWGNPISSHVTGAQFKPLPDRLKIIFFSYSEKQFYKGDFALPYDTILSLFRDGIAADEDNPIYSRIMAGIAPGGAVAVWVTGAKTTEVFFGHAEKIELDPSVAFRVPFESKQESDNYTRKVLEGLLNSEELESIKKDGAPFGLWARYRNRYDWTATFTQGPPAHAHAIFVNGEYEREWSLAGNVKQNTAYPVPLRLNFYSMVQEQKVLYTVTFDEFETMAAFERLGAGGKKVYLEFEPRIPRSDIKARLYNDKESIELKKFVSKK